MKHRLLLLLLVLCAQPGFTQTIAVFSPNNVPAITVDRNTKKTDNPIPFDKGFTLQYPLDQEEIFKVFSYRVEIVKGVRHLVLTGSHISDFHLGKPFDTIKNNLLVNITALPPRTMIDIALLRKLNKKEIEKLMAINELFYNNTPVVQVVDDGIGVQFGRFIDGNLVPRDYSEHPFEKLQYADYKTWFDASLRPAYQSIKSRDYQQGLQPLDRFDVFDIQRLLVQYKVTDSDWLPIARIINNNLIRELMNGTIDISSNYPATSSVELEKYEKRIANLGTAIAYVEKAISMMDKLGTLVDDQEASDVRNALQNWDSLLLVNKSVLSDNYKTIITAVKSNTKLSREEWLIAGNDFNDFTVLSKFVVLPDLGIVTMALKGHDKTFYYPRPFVGINIYFRPVDKSLRECDFPNYNLWRLLSLQVGLTYGNLGNKEFSNLFNDFSLMVGPGYRFNRWFRLGLGTILVTQTNANPIIPDTHTHFGGYFSASVDFDIFSNAGSVRTRIFK